MKISPIKRIQEQINLVEKVDRLGTKVPLEFKNEAGHTLAMSAYVYVFSVHGLKDFVEEIVKETIDETIALLRRQALSPEWVEDNSLPERRVKL